MNNPPIAFLKDEVRKDPALSYDGVKVIGLLKDRFPGEYVAEINLIGLTLEIGIPERIRNAQNNPHIIAALCVIDLRTNHALDENWAKWIVESWISILGFGSVNLSIQAPYIQYFRLKAGGLTSSNQVELEWSVTGDNCALTLNPGQMDVTALNSIKLKVDPSITVPYRLEASNPYGKQVEFLEIDFVAARIIRFASTKELFTRKERFRLYWEVENATEIVLEPDIGDVTNRSHIDLDTPENDTEYRLTVRDGLDRVVTRTVSIKIARINFFGIRKKYDQNNRYATLGVAVQNFQRVMLEGYGEVTGQQEVVLPKINRSGQLLKLSCYTRDGGEKTTSFRVYLANITEFKVDNGLIYEGMQIKIRWKVQHAHTVYLSGVGEVTTKREIFITASRSRRNLTLRAYGDANIVERQISIVVRPLPASIFSVNRSKPTQFGAPKSVAEGSNGNINLVQRVSNNLVQLQDSFQKSAERLEQSLLAFEGTCRRMYFRMNQGIKRILSYILTGLR